MVFVNRLSRGLGLAVGGLIMFGYAHGAQATDPLSLQDRAAVVEYTLRENPQLRAARWMVERARGRLAQSGLLDNPELSLWGRTDKLTGNEGEYAFGVSLSQSFPLAARLKHERAVSLAQLEGVHAEVAQNSQTIALEATQLWRNAIESEAKLHLLKTQEGIALGNAKAIGDAVQRGERSVLDADQSDIEVLALRARIRQATLEKDQAFASLRLLLGVPETYALTLPEPEALPEQNPLASWQSVSLEALPTVRSAQAAVREASSGLAQARAQSYGDITVALDYEQGRSEDVPVGLRTERFIGLSVSVPLPLWNRYDGSIQEYRAATRQAEAQLAIQRQQARQSLSAISAEVTATYASASEVRNGLLVRARQSAERLEHGWQQGEVSLSDLMRARASLIEIELEALSLQMTFHRAMDRYAAASGQLLQN